MAEWLATHATVRFLGPRRQHVQARTSLLSNATDSLVADFVDEIPPDENQVEEFTSCAINVATCDEVAIDVDPATPEEPGDDVLEYIESYMKWLNMRRASIKPLPAAPTSDEFVNWLKQEDGPRSNQDEHLESYDVVPLDTKEAPVQRYDLLKRLPKLYFRSKY
ncbi:hypothetical protein ACHHYP_04992 [Achlya hypogyna]|uniref:Uncharacterized protein n=1 Tax=Achlya hypogyna TaxID=1202772 RepID=A0A1V9YZJ0_ACHHY|nr:hypothetical protein ACHHYP_04992 [Achlya hypogyna]